MESLKKPETIITLINTAALLGAVVYFYRRISNIEEKIDTHGEHLTSTIKKVKEIQLTKKHIEQIVAAIKSSNGKINFHSSEIQRFQQSNTIQDEQIKELQEIISGKLEEIELKHTSNPHLSPYNYNNYRSEWSDSYANNPGYNSNIQPQHYPRQNNSPIPPQAQQVQRHQPQQYQNPQAQYQPPQPQQYQNPQAQYSSNRPPQQYQPQYPPHQPQPQYSQPSPLIHFDNNLQSFSEEDVDNTIDAVRRARALQQDGSLDI